MFPSAELKPSVTISTVTTGPQLHTDEQRIAASAIGVLDIWTQGAYYHHLIDALRVMAKDATPMSAHELSYYASVR